MGKLTGVGRRTGIAIIATVMLTSASGLNAADWWEKVKINGDFRYRHEIIDKEGNDVRNRQRIRARVNITGKVSDEAKITMGISSGSEDPVSNNQTLTDYFSTKALMLDLAYFEISPKTLPGFEFIGGKMNNPFYIPAKSELIWDSDIRQEGITVNYSKKSDKISATLIGSGLWIKERSSDDDTYLAGGQAIFSYDISDKQAVCVGGSYYSYGNLKGRETLYESDDGKGNSVDVVHDTTYYVTFGGDSAIGGVSEYQLYQNDYELLELFGSLDFEAGKTPITLFGDFVTNTAADSLKNGWMVGLKLGKVKEVGSWDLRYVYRNVEKDAVVGAYTDSDFRGGGTDAKGHEIEGSYQLMKNTTFSATYFNNKIGLENDNQTDFQRWQFDLKFKF